MKKGDVHPMVAAMNTLDYDCGTLGNHEFNYGLDFLQNLARRGAKFPLVCANVIKANGETLLKPWLVLDREVVDEAGAKQPIKIGVIGFVPPQIMQWDKAHLDGKATTRRHRRRGAEARARSARRPAPTSSSRSAIPASPAASARAARRTPRCISPKVDGIDVILTGHQHLRLPGRQGIRQHPRRRREGGHAARQARRHGRLLGQPSRPHRSRTRQGRRAAGRSRLSAPRRARSTSASTARSCRRLNPKPPIIAAVAGGP